MAIIKSVLILSIIAGSVFIGACSSEPDFAANNTAANVSTKIPEESLPKTNAEELGMLIQLPYEVEDIVWEQDHVTHNITAILRFSSEDANKLVAEAEKYGAGRAVSVSGESWYPDELIAQVEMSGDSTLKGTAFPANAFFQAPYTSGRVTRVEGVDYFILEVSSK
ncbi:hypothetical protein BH20ACI2_BH20ACI2_18710 [soil metagenome]